MLDAHVESARVAERTGRWDEALRHYEKAFHRLPAEGSAEQATEILRWIGTLHRERRNLEQAYEAYEAALAIAEANGLADHTASALNCLAIVEQYRGNLDEAEAFYTRARGLADEVGDDRLAAMVDQNLGAVANIRGRVTTALDHYRSAIQRYRKIGDDLPTAMALNNAGMAYVDLERWEAADECFREAWLLADRAGDVSTIGTVEVNRAELYLEQQKYEHARQACQRALEIFTHMDSKPGIAEAYKFLGVLHRETGRPQHADMHFGLALGITEMIHDQLLEAELQKEWALLHLEEGRIREALRTLNRAHDLFEELQAGRDAVAVERKLAELHAAYVPVLHTWIDSAVEHKDPHRAGHSGRVAEYSRRLGRAAGLEDQDLVPIRLGAIVHDVGKTVVPADVLNKPGQLDSEERELVQMHTVVGEQIIAEMEFPWDLRPVVRSHHEHWDGTGYPDGLGGGQIPLQARIVALTDRFDALTTDRSYRSAYSSDQALKIMAEDSGTVYDPQLFETFRSMVRGEEGEIHAAC